VVLLHGVLGFGALASGGLLELLVETRGLHAVFLGGLALLEVQFLGL
jgi:hypothetical protein